MDKPEFLYHGSSDGNIELFEPRLSPGTGGEYGKQVYATQDKSTASIFTCNIKKSWSAGYFNDQAYAIIPMDRNDFVENDKGGFIYKVSSETFSVDKNRGLGEREWASSVPVKPIEKEKIESSLSAMVENNVKVFFVTDEQYKEMKESKKRDWHFLENLEFEK